MPHVVTQSCCGDASCVYACPVNCIHPTPDEPDFLTSDMLYIDPVACVDCGACVTACPVDAIVPHDRLPAAQEPFVSINEAFYRDGRPRPLLAPHVPPLTVPKGREPLDVAVVGTGPAAMYAADELLTVPGARVTMYERLSTPYGLARTGVAPDHVKTRQVGDLFDRIAAQDGVRIVYGTQVGRDVTHEELLDRHHAVLYAVGASADRRLDVPGRDLPGTATATEFVAWYNGHPDYTDRRFDLSHGRAVIVGNGNVALDVARILTADPERLAGTSIAPYALDALRRSGVEEVVIVARRGVAHSAFTVPELVGLMQTPGIDLVLDSADLDLDTGALDHTASQKVALLRKLAERSTAGQGKRIVLRYLASPLAITGDDRVRGVELVRNAYVAGSGDRVEPTGERETLDAGLVLSSIGYRGTAVPGVPFDEARGVMPNAGGRVLAEPGGAVLPGVYATGWIKRGPTGFIGTNKQDAMETVRHLVEDYAQGRLSAPRATLV
ncbi:FAD-dependent oxidoreductase [Actinomadura opuntiae]|uniref:FAD-dependent oxidoreductase n=1 Tax=Actinomadura sp. OS1-43 TaxID=604315 RepID=UPI00255AAD48|nr:FAD-dependent oxidoreductase [Actinomadura sp. OS1-43]MDL4816283.1 FAD-dependent oxidoreductase [Actinomadura sp. OS1-43]